MAGEDIGETTARALARLATELGGSGEVLRNRPGSWEAAAVPACCQARSGPVTRTLTPTGPRHERRRDGRAGPADPRDRRGVPWLGSWQGLVNGLWHPRLVSREHPAGDGARRVARRPARADPLPDRGLVMIPAGTPAGLLERLRREHPAWTISAHPLGLGLWTAEHRSDDGRAIHYIVCHTGEEVAARRQRVRRRLGGLPR